MKRLTTAIAVALLVAWRWWEFICVSAIGGGLQVICYFGFMP